MAIKASCTVTLSCYRDTQSVTRYYKLQSSTASAPSKPTTKPPSGWSDSEPSYTSGSTNTLYFCDLTVFSDGTWAYSTVSKSSSYEAAKEAYNKAQAAVEQVIDVNQKTGDIKSEVNSYKERLAEINVITEEIQNCISMLVTDGNGTSLMTQTEDGWTFNIDKINKSVNDISKGLDNLQNELGSTSNTINELSKAVANVSKISAYVKIRLEGNKPCIELGTGDNNFKLLITNTDIRFMEGSSVPAYINNRSLYIKKAIVEEELRQGSFSWVIHGSGNLGLMWK